RKLADDVQKLLTSVPPAVKDSPDAALYQQLASLGGPLFRGMLTKSVGEKTNTPSPRNAATGAADWGLDPTLFGKDPNGNSIDAVSLCVRAPAVITIRLPAD